MSNNFYRAFEDRYRGSRELIKERLQVYQPFIEPLKSISEECSAIDLGCGRGEWLEVLLEFGFEPQGVDLDEGMLKACHNLSLPAARADAVSALKGLSDESQLIVSGFHIAEHLPFKELQDLVSEAFRVLKPGGLLILETPNAENLMVGANTFYLDPTHHRPIPPQLLDFLTEFCGFHRIKTLRLQEEPELREADEATLLQILGGVSPDYAVIAQKKGTEEAMALFNDAFSRDYGVDLPSLCARYEHTMSGKFARIQDHFAQSEHALIENEKALTRNEQVLRDNEVKVLASNEVLQRQVESLHQSVIEKFDNLSVVLRDLERNRGEQSRKLAQACEQLRTVDEQLQAVYASSSWRITAPMRLASRLITNPVSGFKSKVKAIAIVAGKLIGRFALVRKAASVLLMPLPGIKNHLVLFIANNQLFEQSPEGMPTADMPLDGKSGAGQAHAHYRLNDNENSSLSVEDILDRVEREINDARSNTVG